MSIPDVIEYIVSKGHGFEFPAGNGDFNGFDNVELVKK